MKSNCVERGSAGHIRLTEAHISLVTQIQHAYWKYIFEVKRTARMFNLLADGQAYTLDFLASEMDLDRDGITFDRCLRELQEKDIIEVAGQEAGRSTYRLVDSCFPLGRPSPPRA